MKPDEIEKLVEKAHRQIVDWFDDRNERPIVPPKRILRDLIQKATTVPCPDCEYEEHLDGYNDCPTCGNTFTVSRECAELLALADSMVKGGWVRDWGAERERKRREA